METKKILLCPLCNEEIDELKVIQTDYRKSYMDKKGEYNSLRTYSTEDVEWLCPNCEEILFTDEKKAIEFLNN